MFDAIDKLHIDIRAAMLAHDANPSHPGPLIEVITEQHIAAAIRDYFSDCEDWHDDLMPAALAAYRDAERLEQAAAEFAGEFFAAMGFSSIEEMFQ